MRTAGKLNSQKFPTGERWGRSGAARILFVQFYAQQFYFKNPPNLEASTVLCRVEFETEYINMDLC